MCLKLHVSMFLSNVWRWRRLLQAHILQHLLFPMYGDDTQPCVCQQVCLLLEAPHQSCGAVVYVEPRLCRVPRGRWSRGTPRDDQTNERCPRCPRRPAHRGHVGKTLRAVTRRRADHLPGDQQFCGNSAQEAHFQLHGDKRAVPGPNPGFSAGHAV